MESVYMRERDVACKTGSLLHPLDGPRKWAIPSDRKHHSAPTESVVTRRAWGGDRKLCKMLEKGPKNELDVLPHP